MTVHDNAVVKKRFSHDMWTFTVQCTVCEHMYDTYISITVIFPHG